MKIKILVIILSILITLSVIVFTNLNKNEINCNEFGVLYLTEKELPYASELANKINGVVYIPELKQIIGRTEYLECNNPELNKLVDSLR